MLDHCITCGAKLDAEEKALFEKYGPIVCTDCGRDGCGTCMPDGRGCPCPACWKKQVDG